MAEAKQEPFSAAAEKTAAAEQAIQNEIDQKDKHPLAKRMGRCKQERGFIPNRPCQTTFEKPGNEGDLELTPMYDAPHYKGSEKLKERFREIKGQSCAHHGCGFRHRG